MQTHLISQDLKQILGIPAGFHPFGLDPDLDRMPLFEQIDRHMPYDRQIFWGIIFAHPTATLIEGQI